ncbi:MAG TPA: histidine phosphatase family protein [Rhodocyclaceae bacterium]|nr:histidine phosphatase family protein [Rhodocyclaceae bacterium]HMV20754.1 histidine phosphatase family protein [Rhodocyclaceae bacterium]HMW76608.1 histidine phosphatase family protein [Rhodocyclaceae bacterium]HNE41622.1 histidine phosphatase family protein [Rhodocyclaceae bacterium]HNL22168.1 histidine phosphatase family protein [Rhodocyclaceae bacterium]
MDLLLWRHAEAEDGPVDLERPLTPRGEKQARAMARWILGHAPSTLRIVVSPALRCQQTAAALGRAFETSGTISLDSSADAILREAGSHPDSRCVVIVGHQPLLGRLTAWLLAGREMDWAIKKGGLYWISVDGTEGIVNGKLRCAISPEML